MCVAVTSTKALPGHQLLLTFDGGEQRRFDMTHLLREGIFAQLDNTKLFNSVDVSFDTIAWSTPRSSSHLRPIKRRAASA